MAGELAGKVAIVTGAARGIGRGIAEVFVAEGARVVIADVMEEAGRATEAELGDAATFVRCDVSRRDEVQALVDHAVATFGGLHAMVNNAGISDNAYGRLLDDDFARFEPVMQINVLGVMLGTQIAARHMARNGGGAIVNISSISGMLPGHGLPVYRASKAAVQNFSQSAAIELGEHFIRVNAICPGNVPSDMGTFKDSPGADPVKLKRISDSVMEARLNHQLIRRPGAAEDIGHCAMYLACDRATYVTGQIFAVDGGATAGAVRSQINDIVAARTSAERE